jgi:hypothetical protein
MRKGISVAFAAAALVCAETTASGSGLRPKDSVLVSASVVPAVASVNGAYGSRYVSSISLANPHPFPLVITAYLLPLGSNNTNYQASARTINLPANGGTRIEDPLATLWSTAGLASVYLEATPNSGNDASFAVVSRILNVANPAATFGLALPGSLSGVTASDVGYAADIESDSVYRTNFGLFNDSSKSVTVMVDLLDNTGGVMGSKAYPLLPYSLLQANVSDIVAGSFGRATLRVTPPSDYDGQLIGYAAVADNTTGDASASLLQIYRLP